MDDDDEMVRWLCHLCGHDEVMRAKMLDHVAEGTFPWIIGEYVIKENQAATALALLASYETDGGVNPASSDSSSIGVALAPPPDAIKKMFETIAE